MFNYDCEGLGLNDQTQREWYYALLKKLSEVMPGNASGQHFY